MLPVSFRHAGKISISQLNGSPKWPEAPDHQNGLESFRYPSGGPSVQACLGFPVKPSVNRSVNGSVNGSVNLPVSFRRAGKNACLEINKRKQQDLLHRFFISAI